MGDPQMSLREEDVKRIGDYVKPWLRDLVTEMVPHRPSAADTQLLERMVRVEEELKAQRELMGERFEAVDRRFVSMQESMDKRFEAVDKRFESMDKRFEDMKAYTDRRFSTLQWSMMLGFTVVTAAVTVFGLLG